MASIDIYSAGEDYIKARIEDLDTSYTDDDRYIKWYIDGDYDGKDYLDGGVSRSDIWTFSGLDDDTTYEISCILYWNSGTKALYKSATTDEKEVSAEVDIVSTTATTIKARVVSLDTSYTSNDRYIKWYIDGDYDGKDYLDGRVSSSDTYTFDGLLANTRYAIKCTLYWNSGSKTLSTEYATTANVTRPPYFYWKSKYSSIIANDIFKDVITAEKWNEFLDNINDLRYYRDQTTSSSYSQVDWTTFQGKNNKAYSGSLFYAYMYNNAKLAFPTTSYLPNVSTGGKITADLFMDLQNLLNSID